MPLRRRDNNAIATNAAIEDWSDNNPDVFLHSWLSKVMQATRKTYSKLVYKIKW